ncbi:MAG: HIT domain-containing protein [Synergistales bacterium]|nr:HIT domain-containing protein [Synergistales bacterium]
MHHIWAPWRMAYIKGEGKSAHGCIFCDFPKEHDDQRRHILQRGERCFVMMNLFPYNPGHLMVVPYRHIAGYEELTDEEGAEMHRMAREWVGLLRERMQPQGFNMGINMGKVAGAGYEEHIHLHIVPRWNGDMNFMPVLGETRVVPETIDATYAWLCEQWEQYRHE